jgi:hypothetical protein
MSERMTDDYLWDRSGEPDETLRHLESVLGEYRHTGTAGTTRPGRAARRSAFGRLGAIARVGEPRGSAKAIASVRSLAFHEHQRRHVSE